MMKTIQWQTLARGALLLAVLALAGVLATMYSGAVSAAPGAEALAGPLPQAVATLPPPPDSLTEMLALDEVDASSGTVELWAKPGTLTMPDGVEVNVWGFSASETLPPTVPGPVISADAGTELTITLHNTLGEDVSLAFPGFDGLVPDTVGAAPGGSVTYQVTLGAPGTFLYEAGLTEGGARQAAMGLYGVLVVEDPAVVPEPLDQERILVLSEIDPALNANPAAFSLAEFKPKYWLLNGQAYPMTGKISVQAGSNLLIRWVNAGALHRSVGILGLAQEIVAADGMALPFSRGAQAEALAPGQTRDALVHVPTDAPMNALYPIYPGNLRQHNDNQRLGPDEHSVAFGGSMAFLHVATGVEFEEDGPVVSEMAFDKSRIGAGESVALTARITVVGGTSVEAARGWWDVPGDEATALSLTVDAGAVNEVAPGLDDLGGGQHILYIQGLDDLGKWGPLGSAVLTVDNVGPRVTGMVLNPDPTNGTKDVRLSATANESETGGGTVDSGQFSGGVSGTMEVAPPDARIAVLSATIPMAEVAALGEGQHPIAITATDDLGNASASSTVTLTVDMTGPAVGPVTLSPETLDLNQPLPTYVRLTVDLTDAMSPVVNAYAFLGDASTDLTTAIPLFPSDGLFDEAEETAYYNMPVAHFAVLGEGTHVVSVIGKDKAGNLTDPGAAGTATLEVVGGGAPGQDTVGPVITNLAVTPNPTLGQNRITLAGTATDAVAPITAAEWFRGADPGPGNGNRMNALDGSFSSAVEGITVSFNIANPNQWPLGTNTLSVRAQDANGNWGAVQTVEFVKSDRFGRTVYVDGIVSENFLPLLER
jgi:hypothetical protein